MPSDRQRLIGKQIAENNYALTPRGEAALADVIAHALEAEEKLATPKSPPIRLLSNAEWYERQSD